MKDYKIYFDVVFEYSKEMLKRKMRKDPMFREFLKDTDIDKLILSHIFENVNPIIRDIEKTMSKKEKFNPEKYYRSLEAYIEELILRLY